MSPIPHQRSSRRARAHLLAPVVATTLAAALLVAGRAPAAVVSDGMIATVAGTGVGGFTGDGGEGTDAQLRMPRHAVVAPDGTVYIADGENNVVRRLAPDGTLTTVAGTGAAGSTGDGGPAIQARLEMPHAVTLGPTGDLYIADSASARVRRVGADGIITTVAGSGVEGFSGDNGPATAAQLKNPKGLAFGPDGALYISDGMNHRVRKVRPDGIIVTVAGNGTDASTGDGGPAKAAGLRLPRGLAFDRAGDLFVADGDGHRVRRIDTSGVITTVAGTGVDGYGGDGIPATQSPLAQPHGVAVDAAGRLFIADTDNHRVRMVDPDGTIYTVAGTGTPADGGDGGAAIYAALHEPRGIALDRSGNLYIADTLNNRLRKVLHPVPAPPGLSAADAQAVAETDPVAGAGDAADDAAIWVHPSDPSLSLVIGTDKVSDTLEVYDLAGRRLQRLPDSNKSLNNVDVRGDFDLGGRRVGLVATSGSDLRFLQIDPATRQLSDVTVARTIRPVHGANGVCMYTSRKSGKTYAFSTQSDGNVEQFELFVGPDGLVDARSVRGPWDVHPEPVVTHDGEIEACAADDETGSLYISEQEVGIWRYGAEPGDSTAKADRVLVGGTATFNAGPLATDVEGLAVVPGPDGGYIVASSQGDDSYVVFRRRAPYQVVRKLRVIDGPLADGCTHSDGIEASGANLGPAFPLGLFVCQDNENRLAVTSGGTPGPPAGTKANQDFKYVPLERVLPLGGPLPATTTTTTPPTTSTGPSTTTTSTSTSTVTTPTTSSTTTTTAPPATSGDPGATTQRTIPTPPVVGASGYWMLDAAGQVYPFGDAVQLGGPAGRMPAGVTAVDLEPTPTGHGYRVLAGTGEVYAYGDASTLGSLVGRLAAGEAATSLSGTPSGAGYWIFTNRGRVVAFGDARFLGDMSGTRLNGPVLDSIATPTGLGYYMVASDGGIFAFGDAGFSGSMGGARLNAPVQSLVPDPDGRGYWLVASDGGVFAFDAGFRGSMGSVPLNAPVTGMVPYGNGYLMVATDGGVFTFSDRAFSGSLGARPPSAPMVSVAVSG